MSKRDGSWLVNLEGYPPVSTDDLTLDELEVAEGACAVPYTLMDPHASIRIAKALLAVLLIKAGATEDEAVKAAGHLPVRKLHGAFTYMPPSDPRRAAALEATEAPSDPPAPAPTSDAG